MPSKKTALKTPSRTTLTKIMLFGVVPAIAITGAGLYWLQGARYVSTQNAYVKTDIAKLAAEVSGRAVEVRAHAHMPVKAGDVRVRTRGRKIVFHPCASARSASSAVHRFHRKT